VSFVIRVLICDDAPAFTELVRHWFDDAEDLELVGIATTAEGVLTQAAELRPDVIVLDHILGRRTSEDLAPRVREAAPGAKVLLVSGMPGHTLSEAADANGADAFLAKSADPQTFFDAIRSLI